MNGSTTMPPPAGNKLLAYGRLLKPRSQAASLCTVIAMSLASARYQDRRFWAVMLAFLLFNFLGGALTVVLDDINGFQDGSDRLDVVASQKRNISKPLLTGDLTSATRAAWPTRLPECAR